MQHAIALSELARRLDTTPSGLLTTALRIGAPLRESRPVPPETALAIAAYQLGRDDFVSAPALATALAPVAAGRRDLVDGLRFVRNTIATTTRPWRLELISLPDGARKPDRVLAVRDLLDSAAALLED